MLIQKLFKFNKKSLLLNLLYSIIWQGTNYLLPLIAFPYLVRVLGPEKFGLISFAQAFTQYFMIFTDFGFNLFATREISIYRNNRNKLIKIFSTVILIKLGLLLISFIILLVLIFNVDIFKYYWELFLFSFGMVIGQTLFPVWFFQGLEKIKFISFFNFLIKTSFLLLILLFVKHPSDYIYVPLLNSLSSIIVTFIVFIYIYKQYKIKIILPKLLWIKSFLKRSFLFFLSRLAVSVYTYSNTFILGLTASKDIVGFYSIAEKLYIAVQQIFAPLIISLYPYIAYKKDINFYKKIFIIVVLFNIGLVAILNLVSSWLIKLIFGSDLEIVVKIFKILLCSLLVVVPSILLGYPFLAAIGYSNYANMSVIIGALIHITGLFLLYQSNKINIYSLALLIVITESFVLLIRLIAFVKILGGEKVESCNTCRRSRK